MFRKCLSILLAFILSLNMVFVMPITIYAKEVDFVSEGANLDLAETGNPYDRYAVGYDGNWANCTYWAWQYAYEAGYPLPDYSWGHGGSWYANAQRDGYYCDSTPSVNSIMCTGSGTYGHVAYVTDYNSTTGQVYIKQGGVRNTADGRDEWWTSAYPGDLQGYIHLGGVSEPPNKPNNLHAESGGSVYRTDEYITFVWDRVSTADHYWIYMWKNGTEIYHTSVGNNTSHTTAPLGVGSYSFAVRAGNSSGYSDTVDVSFIVTDSAPNEPSGLQTSTGATLFRSDEYITFTWDRVSTADHYWVYSNRSIITP